MDRQAAIATVMYIQKAHAIVPTTGAEWDMVRNCLRVIELVANGQATIEMKPVEQPKANGRDHAEGERERALSS